MSNVSRLKRTYVKSIAILLPSLLCLFLAQLIVSTPCTITYACELWLASLVRNNFLKPIDKRLCFTNNERLSFVVFGGLD